MSSLAIKLSDLGQQFGKTWAVRHLDLQVPTGAVFGLLGENGAGKSTTIQMCMGLLPATEGTVNVLGLNPVTDDVAVKSSVGYVAEHHGFYENMAVDNIISMIAAYHRTWNNKLRDELQREFELAGSAQVSDLSKGMRGKLALLMALSFEPDLLILDEPASGLDPAARRHFIETILAHYQESGRTILLSSHLLNDFSGLLDHVAFLQEGKVDLFAPLQQLHDETKRVRLIYDGGVPATLTIPDAIASRRNGREASAIISDFSESHTVKQLHELNPSKVIVEDVSLEDIFVARAGR